MMFGFYFKHAPYLYVLPFFLTMLTQYAYNTVGFLRKKRWGWGHAISEGKVGENMINLMIFLPSRKAISNR